MQGPLLCGGVCEGVSVCVEGYRKAGGRRPNDVTHY